MSTRFNHLNFPNHWEHYWTKYPEGYTILEALLNWVRQVNDMSDNLTDINERMDEFIAQFDGELQSKVSALLTEWMEAGILDDIINEAIFSDLNEKITNAIDIPVKDFLQVPEETYDNAITRAIDSVITSQPITLTFPREDVKLYEVVTRRDFLTLNAYGTNFIPTSVSDFMWTHYGDYFTVKGCSVTPETTDVFRGFKHMNDAQTPLSSYGYYKDVLMTNLYQGIDFYNESGLGGACYRHRLNNVRVIYDREPRKVLGSFGIRFHNNDVNGDSAGNDTKLIDVFIKGYEKNLIVGKSVGTKLHMCGLDGGAIAIELDQGSYFTVSQSYVEYNDTFISYINEPYRPMLIATTVGNYSTYSTGQLYNDEQLLNIDASSPPIREMKHVHPDDSDYSIVSRLSSGHGGGIWIDNEGVAYDFTDIDGDFILKPTKNIDLYEHIPSGNKKIFGDHTSTEYTTIDGKGTVMYQKLAPNTGLTVLSDGVTSPDTGRNPFLKTANTVGTSIVALDYGIVGQKVTLIVDDPNTTLVHSPTFNLKSKTDVICEQGDTFEFICSEVTTEKDGVWYEV